MGKQDKNADSGKISGERRPLDGLAQRLGALEESLTVVASELGVSAMPRFKRLDPDSVYKEAVRRAQDVGEPLRIAIRKLDARLDEMALAQAQIRRELQGAHENPEQKNAIAAIEAGLAALSARLDATVMPIDQNEAKLRDLNESIEKLSVRLDTIWQRFDEQSRANVEAKPLPEPAAIDPRLAALEQRIEQVANKLAAVAIERKQAEPNTTALEAIVEERVSAARLAMIAHLENRMSQLAPPEATAVDTAAIAAEVGRQIQAHLSEASAERAAPLPLLNDRPTDRGIELNPLVMSATERAIVRLTHRLEKLEEWKQANGGDTRGARGGRSIMGRLFET